MVMNRFTGTVICSNKRSTWQCLWRCTGQLCVDDLIALLAAAPRLAVGKLDDGWPESKKHVLQAALSMVVVKNSRWMVGEFDMSYGGESCEITHRRFCTQTLSQTRLHTETFTHRRFYTQTLLHADALTQKLLHTDSFTHRRFHRRVYTQRLLHTDAFTHRHFYTQTLLHTEAFTRRCFYTQKLLHTDTFSHKRFYTQTLLHTDPFTHRRFYTQRLLHADAFTHTHFHTQRLLHTEAFEECLYMTFYGPELKLFRFWHQAHDGIELCCKRLQTFH